MREGSFWFGRVAIQAERDIERREKGALGMGERWVFIFHEGPPYGSDPCILDSLPSTLGKTSAHPTL